MYLLYHATFVLKRKTDGIYPSAFNAHIYLTSIFGIQFSSKGVRKFSGTHSV